MTPTLTDADAQARALALVQAYCGWHIAPTRQDTVILDGPGSGALLLPSLAVVSVESVNENATLVDPGNYQWSASGVLRRTWPGGDWTTGWSVAGGDSWAVDNQPRWTNTLRGLEVTFTHGYDTMPLDVQTALDALAARIQEGATGTLLQVGAVQYAPSEDGSGLGSSDYAVLSRYKLPPRP